MNAYYKGQAVFGPRGPAGPDGNPIGTVISFMGASAPADYLICDGAQYSISQYPALASFFEAQFGTKNHFGGNGTTTFAVPDMRNLFLRGYHGEAEEQLSGEIGEKQEATKYSEIVSGKTSNGTPTIIGLTSQDNNMYNFPQNIDTREAADKQFSFQTATFEATQSAFRYTGRPVNMAVLYCIKAVESSGSGGEPAGEVYSTEETRIGTWINGKPIYRKTIVFENASIPSGWGNANPRIVKIPNSDMETLIDCASQFYPSGADAKMCTTASIIDGFLTFFNNYSTGTFTCSGTFTLKYTKTIDEAANTTPAASIFVPPKNEAKQTESVTVLRPNPDFHPDLSVIASAVGSAGNLTVSFAPASYASATSGIRFAPASLAHASASAGISMTDGINEEAPPPEDGAN